MCGQLERSNKCLISDFVVWDVLRKIDLQRAAFEKRPKGRGVRGQKLQCMHDNKCDRTRLYRKEQVASSK